MSHYLNPMNFCQMEIPVRNFIESKKFYQDVFGWSVVPVELHDYVVLKVPKECSFGVSLVPALSDVPNQSQAPIIYFRCEDPNPILDALANSKGRFLLGPKTMPGFGKVIQLADPDGNRWGLFLP